MARVNMSPLFIYAKQSCKKHANSDIEANAIYNTVTGPIEIK